MKQKIKLLGKSFSLFICVMGVSLTLFAQDYTDHYFTEYLDGNIDVTFVANILLESPQTHSEIIASLLNSSVQHKGGAPEAFRKIQLLQDHLTNIKTLSENETKDVKMSVFITANSNFKCNIVKASLYV